MRATTNRHFNHAVVLTYYHLGTLYLSNNNGQYQFILSFMNFYNKGKMDNLFNYYTLILIICMTKSSSIYLSKMDIDIFLFLRDTDIRYLLENTLLIVCLGICIKLLIDLDNFSKFDNFHTYLYNPHASGRLFDHHGRQSDSPSLQ